MLKYLAMTMYLSVFHFLLSTSVIHILKSYYLLYLRLGLLHVLLSFFFYHKETKLCLLIFIFKSILTDFDITAFLVECITSNLFVIIYFYTFCVFLCDICPYSINSLFYAGVTIFAF